MVRETKRPQSRWALVVAVLGSSMAFVDGTVVNVALPVMQRSLGATVREVQWIVEAYALFLGSLVLVGGALGDRLGRRRVFSAGVIVFALASVGCGAAPGIKVLIAARALQGLGAAMLVPGSLALISAAHSQETRGRAIGSWSAWTAIASALGPVAGGWVVSHASWRWLFLFNVPVATTVVLLARTKVAESHDPEAAPRLDLAGAALATVGLGLLVYALVEFQPAGQSGGASLTFALLLLAAVVLAAFIVVEARQAAPMLPLALFRSRTFAGANLLTLLLYAALGGALFFVPFNLIQVQRYSPTAAGASLLPLVLLISTMSRGAGTWAARLGARPLLCAGPLLAAVGFALLALPARGGSYWSTFFPGIVVLGLGMGVTVAPLTTAVMGAVAPQHAGVASGINNAVARTAGLLAIAALGMVLLQRFNGVLDDALAPLSLPAGVARAVDQQRNRLAAADFSALDPRLVAPLHAAFDAAYVAAFRTVMMVSAVLAALAAVAALVFIYPVDRGEHGRHQTGPTVV